MEISSEEFIDIIRMFSEPNRKLEDKASKYDDLLGELVQARVQVANLYEQLATMKMAIDETNAAVKA